MNKILKCFMVLAVIFAWLITGGCSKDVPASEKEFPPPSELYGMIEDAADLPEMAKLEIDLFPYIYGIETEWFEEAVSYSSIDITRPDEIVIVKCLSRDTADEVFEKLKFRLAYKNKSAQNYFPETIIFIKNGVIRQDDLTVSLLVLEKIDTVVNLYDNIK